MARKPELVDEENAAMIDVLRGWKAGGDDMREIGMSLNYERATASQVISRIVGENATGRVGRDMRDRILKRLGVSREAFLRTRGLSHVIDVHPDVESVAQVVPIDIDRILAVAEQLGRSVADVRQVRDTAARSGTITDEEIAGLFRALDAKPEKVTGHRVIETEDDLFGGSAAIPKLPPRKGRRR